MACKRLHCMRVFIGRGSQQAGSVSTRVLSLLAFTEPLNRPAAFGLVFPAPPPPPLLILSSYPTPCTRHHCAPAPFITTRVPGLLLLPYHNIPISPAQLMLPEPTSRRAFYYAPYKTCIRCIKWR